MYWLIRILFSMNVWKYFFVIIICLKWEKGVFNQLLAGLKTLYSWNFLTNSNYSFGFIYLEICKIGLFNTKFKIFSSSMFYHHRSSTNHLSTATLTSLLYTFLRHFLVLPLTAGSSYSSISTSFNILLTF